MPPSSVGIKKVTDFAEEVEVGPARPGVNVSRDILDADPMIRPVLRASVLAS